MTLKEMYFSAWDKYENLTDMEKGKRRIYGIIILVPILILFIFICLLFPQIILEGSFGPIAGVIGLTIIWIIWRKEWKKKREEEKILKRFSPKPVERLITVMCPHCNNTFQIPQQNKPFRVKCPKCGKESMLR